MKRKIKNCILWVLWYLSLGWSFMIFVLKDDLKVLLIWSIVELFAVAYIIIFSLANKNIL